MMKFQIYTLGCKVNAYESEVMKEKLLKNGYTYDDVIPVKQIQVMPMELPKIKDEDNILDSLNITQKEPKFEVDSNPIETQEFKLFSYEKEEAFLKALKELNELLNWIDNKIMVQ